MKKENTKVVAAFQVWRNGGWQTSGLYLASRDGQDRVDHFIESHYNSGTFAELHTFTNEEAALADWKYWRED